MPSASRPSFFWMNDGTLYAVGNSDYGTLGKQEGSYSTHKAFYVPEKPAALSCGFGHCLLLTENGEVYAWGRGGKGQVGNGSRQNALSPVKLPLQNIVSSEIFKDLLPEAHVASGFLFKSFLFGN